MSQHCRKQTEKDARSHPTTATTFVEKSSCHDLFLYQFRFNFFQKLNQELQDALDEKESLKTQVQDYMLEVRRTEDLLSAKVSVISK